ncbi:MAG: PQQ-binding-like beta-propeller repeat protein [Thermaerobacter sp.]|nr:PQQ-binding-like beta-propeller repeat protein [Thermaerobacter sp.]
MAYPHVRDRSLPQLKTRPVWYPVTLAMIGVLGLILRLIGLAGYPGLIYDEFYYVPAADVLLRRPPIAGVKNMIPGIDPNLLSHPPLSKELVALAIVLFGQHPLVWRLPAMALGAMVPLMAAGVAWELFHHRAIAVGAAGLTAIDGLSIVMSRVALPDAPAVTFVMGSLWLTLTITNRLVQAQRVGAFRWIGLGVLLGLGLAAEWIGAQAILLVWAWFLVRSPATRKAFHRWIPVSTIVPFVVYYATYFYAWTGGYHEPWLPRDPFIAFFKLQWLIFKGMWNLTFFHPWTANVWTWLGIPRPTAMLLSLKPHQSVRMMAFSDPIIVWIGLVSLVAGIWWVRRHRQYLAAWGFLALWFLALYGTWLLTPRSKFLYYFTSASLGLDIAAAAGFVLVWDAARSEPVRQWVRGGLAVFGSTALLTVSYLVPLWVGMAMPRPFYHALWWPSSWNPRVKASSVPASRSFSLTMNPRVGQVEAWRGVDLPAVGTPVPSPWQELRGTFSHNSVFWAPWALTKSYQLKLANAGLMQAPAILGHTAYVGTENNQVYAVNLLNGAVTWAVGVPNMVMTTPLIDQGLVVVGLGNSAFRAYSRAVGWVRGAGTNGLMAFDAKTGTEAWFYHTQGEVMATPAIRNGVIYDVTGASQLIAVSLESGKLLWSRRLGGFDSTSSPVIVGHHVYVATNAYYTDYPARRSTVWSVNLTTHRVSWSRNLPVASGLSDCSIAANGVALYVAGVPWVSHHGQGHVLSQRIFALSKSDGQVLWAQSMGRGRLSGLDQAEDGTPLATASTVYEGGPAIRRLVAFNASTGEVLWRQHIPGGVTANPVLAGSRLVVASRSGRILALSARTGKVVASDPWPFGAIGSAAPLIVSNALIQSTLKGELVVQRLGH